MDPLLQHVPVVAYLQHIVRQGTRVVVLQHMQLLGHDAGAGVNVQRHLELPARLVPITFRQTALGRSINPIEIVHVVANLDGHSLKAPLRVIIAVDFDAFLRNLRDADDLLPDVRVV